MTADQIALLLPGIFQRTLRQGHPTPLDALLGAMESLHEGPEQALAGFDTICDPNRAPDVFVPFLAHWVDLDRIFPAHGTTRPDDVLGTGIGRLRQLTAAAARLAKWRGTREGLLEFLRTATGLDGFSIDESAGARPFHLRISAPDAAREHRSLLARIIDVERPACCTWELVFVDEREADE